MGFGFAAPLWLGAIGLIAPLVWLYLRSRPRPPAIVSSLLLWKELPAAPAPRRRPRLPLLFFVQALLIAAGALAMAGPFRSEPAPPGPPTDAVLVLDVSASMQAKQAGSTRFADAQVSAIERARELAAAPPSRRITILAAGVQPRVVATGLDGDQAEAAIQALQPLDTPANLTAAVELAATLAGREGSVDLFTDVPDEDIVLSRDARGTTSVHRFGEGGGNAAISRVDVRANPFSASQPARALVAVRGFAAETREIEVELAPLADAGAAMRQKVVVPPGKSEVASFPNIPWKGAFAARIVTPDDLEVDDIVYGLVPARDSTDVLLVSEDAELARELTKLAARIGGLEVRALSPTKYMPEERADVTLFDRFVPLEPPAGNAVYLAPSRGNSDVTVLDRSTDLRLAEIRQHELLRGVQNVHTLLGKAPVGLAPGALPPLLLGRSEGREVALAEAGMVAGRRVVATGFRLDPKALRSADGLPSLIFTLNLLAWLTPEIHDAPWLRGTGERLYEGAARSTPIERLEGPDGGRSLGPTEDPVLERAGIYTTSGADASRQVLVSFVEPAESDIRRPAMSPAKPARPARPSEESSTAEPSWRRISLLPAFLFLMLGAMLTEWAVLAAPEASSAGSRER